MSERTRIRRAPKRAEYSRDAIRAIIDAALVCHVAFTHAGEPAIIPTAVWRDDDWLYIHGSRESRMLKALAAGAASCVAITLLDGLVLARSGFNHSMNYRSVVCYGQFEQVTDPDAVTSALDQLIDKMVPGRAADCRPASRKELAATTVLRMRLDEASAKIRSGPPDEPKADRALRYWGGVIPLRTVADPAVGDAYNDGTPMPGYVEEYAP